MNRMNNNVDKNLQNEFIMSKKLIIIAVVAIMLLGVFGLAGCTESLDDYKSTAKAAIQTYALEKGLNNEYTAENWADIESIADQGLVAVEEANNKPAVDTAVITVKVAMDDVPTEVEMAKILSEFDLTDPKVLWEGTINDEFEIDRVIIIMKKTTTYPELELLYFGLSNGDRLEYSWIRPSSENTPNFRQILTIYLKQQGKDKVIAAINELEKLEFVKTVEPQYIFGTQDN